MDDKQARGAPEGAPERSLREALRAARLKEAERTGVVVALRDAEMARLDMLRDKLEPVFAQVPAGVELFDVGLTPGETPRLWIDMVAFVAMGRDKRTYRFLQDTRLGRTVIAEDADPDRIADAVTAYVAHRLIERERLIAGERPFEPVPGLPRATLPEALAALPPAAAEEEPAPPLRRGLGLSRLSPLVYIVIGMALGAGGLLALAQILAR